MTRGHGGGRSDGGKDVNRSARQAERYSGEGRGVGGWGGTGEMFDNGGLQKLKAQTGSDVNQGCTAELRRRRVTCGT
jgi:hypothetical protein